MKDELLLLNEKQISQKINRLAFQLYEDNFEEGKVVLAGVAPRGTIIAQRLKKVLEKISDLEVTTVDVEITEREKIVPLVKLSVDPATIEGCAVVLVDDVLNSGKTLTHALGAFLTVPLKKLRTVVLVDRNHKAYPVATDFAGLSLSTVSQEHVDVKMGEGAEESVYLR